MSMMSAFKELRVHWRRWTRHKAIKRGKYHDRNRELWKNVGGAPTLEWVDRKLWKLA